jgi:outer membrane immunogenic protein
MKRLLLGTAAMVALLGAANPSQAADMAVKAPPPIAAPIFTWTGFYLGGNLGAAWAQRSVTDVFGNTFTRTSDARFIGGGQLGYNWQFTNFVLGVEGDIDGIMGGDNNPGSAPVLINGAGPFAVTSNTPNSWVATLAARFGWAADHWLFYGKAGGGWVGNSSGFTVTNVTTGLPVASVTNGNSVGGWLLGGGVEWAFTNNWSLKGEYDYIGLNNRNFAVPVTIRAGVVDTFTSSSRNFQMVKFGFNYSFR